LIIGDVMIDSYMWGHVTRISPEAPVPIVAIDKKEDRLGGAANVALNIQAMGATPILCAVVGDDKNGKLFSELLKKQKIQANTIIESKQRITTVKTRVIGNNHQMLRVDEEINSPLNSKEAQQLLTTVKKIVSAQQIDVIIFEDYDKGCLTPEVIKGVLALANKKNIPTAVDPKKNNFWEYTGVTLFKPNLKELKEGLKLDFDPANNKELSNVVNQFIKKQKIKTALVTLSDKGMYTHSDEIKKIIPAHIRTISDVSGAGDTVISIAALCIAAGLNPITTATLANLAGGLVCEQTGVVPINKKQLLQEALEISIS
ncbi:MAG TPA: bifunctional ADP-heptose synthase, partial [Bacteroidia bacterium]|nr:bifunctional ADP-heptose synthase [Bacteroidia bacterium]